MTNLTVIKKVERPYTNQIKNIIYYFKNHGNVGEKFTTRDFEKIFSLNYKCFTKAFTKLQKSKELFPLFFDKEYKNLKNYFSKTEQFPNYLSVDQIYKLLKDSRQDVPLKPKSILYLSSKDLPYDQLNLSVLWALESVNGKWLTVREIISILGLPCEGEHFKRVYDSVRGELTRQYKFSKLKNMFIEKTTIGKTMMYRLIPSHNSVIDIASMGTATYDHYNENHKIKTGTTEIRIQSGVN